MEAGAGADTLLGAGNAGNQEPCSPKCQQCPRHRRALLHKWHGQRQSWGRCGVFFLRHKLSQADVYSRLMLN